MAVNCIHCGHPIDTGTIGHDKPKGEAHITFRLRRGFREAGVGTRIHTECFEEVFDYEFKTFPEWAEEDDD